MQFFNSYSQVESMRVSTIECTDLATSFSCCAGLHIVSIYRGRPIFAFRVVNMTVLTAEITVACTLLNVEPCSGDG